jgi:hypothetical protein
VDDDVVMGQEPTPEDRRVLEEALAAGFDGAYVYPDGTWTGLKLRPPVRPDPVGEGG